MSIVLRRLSFAAAFACLAVPLRAQDATIVYRLGRDTVAVEQYTRTPTRFSGEMVSRAGTAVTRTQYVLSVYEAWMSLDGATVEEWYARYVIPD